jgi:hypothetical protein
MSNNLFINHYKFNNFGLLQRAWYKLRPTTEANLSSRLKVRGLLNSDIGRFSKVERQTLAKAFTSLKPQEAIKALSSGDFKVTGLRFDPVKGEPHQLIFFRSALWMASRAGGSKSGFKGLLYDVFVAAPRDFGKDLKQADGKPPVAEGKKKSTRSDEIVEMGCLALLLSPFYLLSIDYIDLKLFPFFIKNSEYFLSSRYFDIFEWMPAAVDSVVGLGIWGVGNRHKKLNRLEPLPIPMPFLGYWSGRALKRAVKQTIVPIFMGGSILFSDFPLVSSYLKLHSFVHSKREIYEKAVAILEHLKDPALQRAFVRKLLEKGNTEKARTIYNMIGWPTENFTPDMLLLLNPENDLTGP